MTASAVMAERGCGQSWPCQPQLIASPLLSRGAESAAFCVTFQVFEVDASRGQPDGFSLQVEPPRASELSRRICALLADLRRGRSNYCGCFVVRQGASLPSLSPLQLLQALQVVRFMTHGVQV